MDSKSTADLTADPPVSYTGNQPRRMENQSFANTKEHRAEKPILLHPSKAYKFLPELPERKRSWIMLGTIAILLAVIVVGGCLVGVHLTQEHTEAVIEMIYNGQEGNEVQQIVMLNEKKNMAAFVINTPDNNATIVYDFDSGRIGIRVNTEKCFILNMDSSSPPSVREVQTGIERFQAVNTPGDHMVSYSFTQGEPAERTSLGSILNILCNDVPIYWAAPNNPKQNREVEVGGKVTYDKGSGVGVEVSIKFKF